MRIIYCSQYFPPEMGAPAARVYECARAWVRLGHEVTVLTGMPHHPTGVVPPKYRGRFCYRERVDGIDVCRSYVYATPNRGVYRRAWSYLSFMLAAVLTGFFRLRRPDVIVGTSPQLFAAVAGMVLAWLKRAPFVFEVRDLWPESIETVGAVRRRWLLAPLYALVDFMYGRARLVVLVSESARETLVARGIPAEKLRVVTNGVDLRLFRPGAHDNWVRQRYGLGDAFLVLYIGTLGMAHGLEVVIDAAERSRDDDGIKYMLVGEGARKELLREKARHLPNVIFVDGCPRSRVVDFIAAADACLVHLINTELFKGVLPSKIFEIFGCGRPLFIGVEGEARDVVEHAGAGVAFPPEDGEALAALARRMRANRSELEEMGRRGREYAARFYDREALARRYADLLEHSRN